MLVRIIQVALVITFMTAPATAQTYRAYGDSVTNGYNVPAQDGYLARLSSALGVTFSNNAVNGAMSGDQAPLVFNATPAAGDVATVMVGTNDIGQYGVSATKLGYYRAIVQGMVAYLATPEKTLARSGGITYAGTWANDLFISKSSNENGATASGTFTGTAFYLGTVLSDSASGTADVYIDGVNVGSFATSAPGIVTVHGAHSAPALVRYGGLSNTAHTWQVIVTSASGGSNYVYINWAAGSGQTTKSKVYAANVGRFNGPGMGDDTNTAAYSAAVASLSAELVGDGLSVYPVDVMAVINRDTIDLQSDGHPTSTGHAKIKGAMYSVMNSGTIPPTGPTCAGCHFLK